MVNYVGANFNTPNVKYCHFLDFLNIYYNKIGHSMIDVANLKFWEIVWFAWVRELLCENMNMMQSHVYFKANVPWFCLLVVISLSIAVYLIWSLNCKYQVNAFCIKCTYFGKNIPFKTITVYNFKNWIQRISVTKKISEIIFFYILKGTCIIMLRLFESRLCSISFKWSLIIAIKSNT